MEILAEEINHEIKTLAYTNCLYDSKYQVKVLIEFSTTITCKYWIFRLCFYVRLLLESGDLMEAAELCILIKE